MQKVILYFFLKGGVARFAVIISAILFLSNPCKTETIKIPADYETIQQGINNAEHGDTVLVSPGIYYENINFNGKNIVLASLFITTDDTSFISQTVIDGNRQGTVVTFESGEDSTAVLTGFTITNGFIEGTPELSNTAAGIVCNNGSSPIFNHLNVYKNETKGHDFYLGGGVFCGHKSSPEFLNVVLNQNSTNYSNESSGGLLCKDSSHVTMVNCIIKNNNGYNGGGIGCTNAFLQLDDCVFENNYSHSGGAIMGRQSVIEMNDITIANNRAARGGGLFLYDSEGDLKNVDVLNNFVSSFAGGRGGGIYARKSRLFLTKCKISKNKSDAVFGQCSGGGLYFSENSTTVIQNSIIDGNISEYDGGGVSCFDSEIKIDDVMIQQNFAGGGGGGVFASGSILELESATMRRNVSQFKGGGLYLEDSPYNVAGLLFSTEHLSSIYLNKAFQDGGDIANLKNDAVDVMLDSFTVINPKDRHVFPGEKINMAMNHAIITPQKSDLYVSPAGSDSNTGLDPSRALRTIDHALFTADADSLHPITVHIAPGTYSKTKTNEVFPLFVPSNLSLFGEDMNTTILDGEQEKSLLRFFKTKYSQIKNMTITNGHAKKAGGIYSEQSQSIVFENLVVKNNTATKLGGGGAAIWGGSNDSIPYHISFKNVLFIDNINLKSSEDVSGGMEVRFADVKIINSTFSHNLLAKAMDANYAGGLLVWHGSNVTILNSILSYNRPHNIQTLSDSKVYFSYSNIEGGEDGIVGDADSSVVWLAGNIDADPLFVGGEPFDYRLSKRSPCIDAGTAFFEWHGDTLLNLSEDDYFGSAPDMGAFEFNPAVGIESTNKLPSAFKLEQNYPNPFNPSTTIRYILPKSCHVSLVVFDILGRNVADLVNANQKAGAHEIVWNGKGRDGLNLASGVYFYKLKGGGYEEVKKLLLVR